MCECVQLDQMRDAGLRLPKTSGNAGVRAAAFKPKKVSGVRRMIQCVAHPLRPSFVVFASRVCVASCVRVCIRLVKPKAKPKDEDVGGPVVGGKKVKLGVGPVWVPLYGAPPPTRTIAQAVGEDFIRERAIMNEHPDIASFYRCVCVCVVSV